MSTRDYDEVYDNCARCGSSLYWEMCETCPAFGYRPGDDPSCDACGGSGNSAWCLSSAEWCERNPLPGRESVERHTVEWVTCRPDGTSTSSFDARGVAE